MATGKASTSAIKAGEAFVELFADDSKFNQTLKRSTDKFINFVNVIKATNASDIFSGKGIGAMFTGLGLGIKSIGSQLVSLGKLTALVGTSAIVAFGAAGYASLKYVANIGRIAERTDSSTEAVSRIGYAAEQSGIDLDKLEDSFRNLADQTKSAANGSADQEAAFRKLGISARAFEHLSIDEKFVKLAEGMERLPDTLDRNRVLLALFGEEGLRLLPLLKKGADGLRESFVEAEAMGALVRSSDAKQSADALKAFNQVLTSVKTLLIEVGLSILEFSGDMKENQAIILMYLKIARDWVKENRQVVAAVVVVAAVITSVGVALLAVGSIIGIIGGAITGIVAIASVFAAIIGIITVKMVIVGVIIALVTALIVALTYKFFTATEVGKRMAQAFKEAFQQIADIWSDVFGGIFAALKKGDLSLAWDIFLLGLAVTWHKTITDLIDAWFSFTNMFEDAFDDASKGIGRTFRMLFTELKKLAYETVIAIASKTADLFAPIAQLDPIKKRLDAFADDMRKDLNVMVQPVFAVGDAIARGIDVDKLKRDASQIDILKASSESYGRAFDALQHLLKQAKKPAVLPPPGLPVAPMPREKGLLDLGFKKMGDSARGVFDSADFRGSLGLGEANTYAKQAVDIQRGMAADIKIIAQKIDGAFGQMFT